MFPIRDSIPTRRFPIVNVCLIVLNILAFLWQLSLSPEELNAVYYTLGVVPGKYTGGNPQSLSTLALYLPFLTNMFLHGGWLHLIGNIWTLYIFGDNVEDRMGRFAYLAFYLICGLAASWTHIYFNWGADIPAIGASGAISGVMGAYLFLCPKSRIQMLLPIFYIPFFFKIPAWVYLGYWFLLQLFNGTAELSSTEATGGVAFWAHIGGFVAGLALFFFFRRKKYEPPTNFQTYKQAPGEVFYQNRNVHWRR